MTLNIQIARLPHSQGIDLPSYGTAGAAGMGLRAAVPEDQDLVIQPGARALVPTGLTIAVPAGYEAQVRPRSGLALKYGVTCLNSPGTIDSDYRDEIGVILYNVSDEVFTINPNDRIAQMVIAPFVRAELSPVDVLQATERAGCFGSTGV